MIESISLANDNASVAFSVGHSFIVYSTDPLVRKYQKEFSSSQLTKISTAADGTFVSFVSFPPDSPNRQTVCVWNNFYGESHVKIDLDDNDKVTSLHLLNNILLIVIEKKFIIYDIQKKMVKVERETETNPNGASDLIMSPDDVLLAAVCGQEVGKISIYQINGFDNAPTKLCDIFAAKHQVTLMKFSPDSSLVATASEKGTLIRVFDSETGAPLFTFRRGALSSNILDVCFSQSNSELIAVSANGTVHLFQTEIRNANSNDTPRSVAKLTIDKPNFVQTAFKSDKQNELLMLTNSGHFYTLRVGDKTLEMVDRIYVLEH